jgi:hypothetical protein
MVGTNEINNDTETPEDRIRKPGGGRNKIIDTEENIDEVFLLGSAEGHEYPDF